MNISQKNLKNFIGKLKEDLGSKSNRKIKNDLESKLKDLEIDLNNYDKPQKHNKIKSQLEEIYEKFVDDAKITSKCTWYGEEEKSTKFFLNL